MKKIIYYVAISLDGYISGAGGDISLFAKQGGNGVEKYLADLQEFKTVIMGRKTYEFAYQYGLKPGQPAYPHMEHYIFSRSLKFEDRAESVYVEPLSLDRIREIRDHSSTDVYLCGGGQFAGWLLENNLIDEVKIKLNPIILGEGARIFGDSNVSMLWKLMDSQVYDDGLQIMTYKIK